ncbi:DUF29 domain-containing protein [Methylobacterium sp. J-048]|uniref:DUF29 domain-containing protein n=1 Tax=Methylobacterium sp. J-048 TaxID=2836635 RepID=UPI001FBB8206|nr:DUF29 domain-containing protein [Methylobacterium sp. J-048]MCJ2059458.1 DUF29 domain-containing protein [Methylobacterium sp. J-048]
MTAPKRAPQKLKTTRYEDDVHAWAQEQVHFLQAGAWARLDVEHLADEIADVGRSERHALTGALCVILLHLLKWDHQPARRTRSWVTSIRTQRSIVAERLKDSPSLKPQIAVLVARAYHRARIEAAGETGLDEAAFPSACPYDFTTLMTRPIPWPPSDGETGFRRS